LKEKSSAITGILSMDMSFILKNTGMEERHTTALPTTIIRRYFTESCQTITSHTIITDRHIPLVITYRQLYRQIISVGISQRVATQLPPIP